MNRLEEFVVFNVCKELSVNSLEQHHKDYVLELFRAMDQNIFRGYKMTKIGQVLGKVLSSKLQTFIKSEASIDLKEYQKKALGSADQDPGITAQTSIDTPKSLVISNFLGIDDLDELKMLFNPESMYVHYYVVLDSSYRDTTEEINTAIKKFTWKYSPTQYTGTGFCNSVGVIRDIIGMRMYQPRVPYLAGMNTSAKRVSVLVEELKAQAFIAENGRRFHFLLRPNFITGQTSIELSTEDYNDGIFNFRKPITKIDSFTLSFGDPLNILTFATPFDRFIVPFEMVCLKSDK